MAEIGEFSGVFSLGGNVYFCEEFARISRHFTRFWVIWEGLARIGEAS